MDLVTLVQGAKRPAGEGDLVGDDLVAHALLNTPAIPDSKKGEAIQLARHLLEATGSNKVRNAAALLLADLSREEAKAGILPVLTRPEIAHVSGSLLYALNVVGQTLPLKMAVALIETGSFEAQGEVLSFLDDSRIEPFTKQDLEAAKARLSFLLTDEGREPAARLALEYLDEISADPDAPRTGSRSAPGRT